MTTKMPIPQFDREFVHAVLQEVKQESSNPEYHALVSAQIEALKALTVDGRRASSLNHVHPSKAAALRTDISLALSLPGKDWKGFEADVKAEIEAFHARIEDLSKKHDVSWLWGSQGIHYTED